MPDIGATRVMDDIGRITIPKDYRAALNIHPGDMVECFATPEGIVIKKLSHTCTVCGKPATVKAGELPLCAACEKAVKEAKNVVNSTNQ